MLLNKKQQLLIQGGHRLEGETYVRGAKNAITKLLVASLLTDQPCTFKNVPNLEEVSVTVSLCKEIGMEVDWNHTTQTMHVVTKELKTTYIPQRFSGANRIPILMIGALLGRTEQDIVVPTVGGCSIGKRPVDFHVQALKSLGASVEYRRMKRDGAYFAQAHDGLEGALIHLPYPSVGATENALLAACKAKGKTTIKNASMEPEVMDLIMFLQKIGARISVDIDQTLVIDGVKHFKGATHFVIPDRLEAASLGMLGIVTKGSVYVKGARQEHMISFLNALTHINGGFEVKDEGIEFFYNGPLKGGIKVETDVYPGFATDWQQPFVVLLTQAKGSSIVHETVYENRFGYTKSISQMGASFTLYDECLGTKPCRFKDRNHQHSLVIHGPTKLTSSTIVIPDLRAGFAYVMAAMIAEGTSTLKNIHYLNRGYENLVQKLQNLGAVIEPVDIATTESSKNSSQLQASI